MSVPIGDSAIPFSSREEVERLRGLAKNYPDSTLATDRVVGLFAYFDAEIERLKAQLAQTQDDYGAEVSCERAKLRDAEACAATIRAATIEECAKFLEKNNAWTAAGLRAVLIPPAAVPPKEAQHLSEAGIGFLAEHFKNHTSGPGWLVLKMIATLAARDAEIVGLTSNMTAAAQSSARQREHAEAAEAEIERLKSDLKMEEYRMSEQVRDKYRILSEYEAARNEQRARAEAAEAALAEELKSVKRFAVAFARTQGAFTDVLHVVVPDEPEQVEDAVKALAARAARLEEILRDVEWGGTHVHEEGEEWPACPSCGELRETGKHLRACQIAEALTPPAHEPSLTRDHLRKPGTMIIGLNWEPPRDEAAVAPPVVRVTRDEGGPLYDLAEPDGYFPACKHCGATICYGACPCQRKAPEPSREQATCGECFGAKRIRVYHRAAPNTGHYYVPCPACAPQPEARDDAQELMTRIVKYEDRVQAMERVIETQHALVMDLMSDRDEARARTFEEAAQFLEEHAKGYEDRVAGFRGGANDTTRIPAALAKELREKAGGLRQLAGRHTP